MLITDEKTHTEKTSVWLRQQLALCKDGVSDTEIQQLAKKDPTISYLLEELSLDNILFQTVDNILFQTLLHIVEDYNKTFNLTEQQSTLWDTIVAKWSAIATKTGDLTDTEKQKLHQAMKKITRGHPVRDRGAWMTQSHTTSPISDVVCTTPMSEVAFAQSARAQSRKEKRDMLLADWYHIFLQEAKQDSFLEEVYKLAKNLPPHVRDIAVLDFGYQTGNNNNLHSSWYQSWLIPSWVTVCEHSFWGITSFCDFPKAIFLDDEGRYHNENGPALVWADGAERYYHHGVQIKEWYPVNGKQDCLLHDRKPDIQRIGL